MKSRAELPKSDTLSAQLMLQIRQKVTKSAMSKYEQFSQRQKTKSQNADAERTAVAAPEESTQVAVAWGVEKLRFASGRTRLKKIAESKKQS